MAVKLDRFELEFGTYPKFGCDWSCQKYFRSQNFPLAKTVVKGFHALLQDLKVHIYQIKPHLQFVILSILSNFWPEKIWQFVDASVLSLRIVQRAVFKLVLL